MKNLLDTHPNLKRVQLWQQLVMEKAAESISLMRESEELNPWRQNRYLEVENNHLDPLVHRKLIHPLVQSGDFHLVPKLLKHRQKWNNKNL